MVDGLSQISRNKVMENFVFVVVSLLGCNPLRGRLFGRSIGLEMPSPCILPFTAVIDKYFLT